MKGFRMFAALRAAALPLLIAVLFHPAAAQQQRGTLTGQVLEAQTQRPIASAQVFVTGTRTRPQRRHQIRALRGGRAFPR